MKKALLTMILAIATLTAMAQVTTYHEGFYFDKMSPNGKWLATQNLGTVFMYIQDSDTYLEYTASEDAVTEYYATGIGNCISNDGIIVGGTNDAICAYWQNEKWTPLPLKPENTALNLANGITPDGNRIVGFVGNSGLNMYSVQMIKPVYWDRNSEGSYDMYVELPQPETDFCGRIPQYVTAISISDDGKTIVGQIVDWSGFYIYPIIYTQATDGTWSYRTIDEGVLYAEGTEFMEWPGEEPEAPNGEEFMNEEELAAWNAAWNAFWIEYDKFQNGEIDEYPAEPNAGDYIKERIDEYKNAMREFENILNDYYRKANAFEMDLMDKMYNKCFVFNNVYVSGNGRYYTTTLESLDTSNPLNPKSVFVPQRIDLENGDTMTPIAGVTDMIASSALNDGRWIAQNPKMAYGRNSYIVSPDGNVKIPFVDYINGLSAEVGQWVKNITTFDVLVVTSYDSEGYPMDYEVVEDSIVSGSVHCNSEGTIFTSFMYDEWGENVSFREFSYTINLNNLDNVEGIRNDTEPIYIADNTLFMPCNTQHLAVYDINGRNVLQVENPGERWQLNLTPGIYIVKVTGSEDTQVSKVVVR